jgi:cobalamin transport system substrate-binding protein
MRRALAVALAAALCAAAAPRRTVSLSPNVTEMLYGIGAFPQVVGVSDYCTYPPEARKLPSVGGWANPDLERLTGLRPDLVIVDEAQVTLVGDKLHELGLRVLAVPDQSVADVYRAMTALGRATGHEQAAGHLAAATREGLLRVSRKTAALPKPRVLLIVDRTPGTLRDLYTVTAGSFLADLVGIAGGRIAAPPANGGYGQLSKEDLLAINPDAILDFTHGGKGRLTADPMEDWQEMPELKAVRTHRVYSVNEEYVTHASQRMVLTAGLIARLIHPEAR